MRTRSRSAQADRRSALIDGVEGDLTAMNPEDVESISVLGDASLDGRIRRPGCVRRGAGDDEKRPQG